MAAGGHLKKKRDFWSSTMAAGGHFVKTFKTKLCIDLKWREICSNVIFGYPKWPPGIILLEKNIKMGIDPKYRNS